MRLVYITSLLALSFVVLFIGREANGSYIAPDDDDPESFYWKDMEGDVEEHHRVARSPLWGRRFRVKIKVPNPVRKAGHAISKSVRKVAQNIGGGVGKTLKTVKAGIDKLPSKAKEEIKKAAVNLHKAIKKAKEQIKPVFQKVDVAAKLPAVLTVDLLRKLHSLNHKDVDVKDDVGPTPSEEPSRPDCDASCKLMKKLTDGADFFKQSFCTFYSVKRNHIDFLNDRNLNSTIENNINLARSDSYRLYQGIASAYNKLAKGWNYTVLEIDTKRKVSKDCFAGRFMSCESTRFYEKLLNLKCLIPCQGFDGCELEDKRLMEAVDQAYAAYRKWIVLIGKMLEKLRFTY